MPAEDFINSSLQRALYDEIKSFKVTNIGEACSFINSYVFDHSLHERWLEKILPEEKAAVTFAPQMRLLPDSLGSSYMEYIAAYKPEIFTLQYEDLDKHLLPNIGRAVLISDAIYDVSHVLCDYWEVGEEAKLQSFLLGQVPYVQTQYLEHCVTSRKQLWTIKEQPISITDFARGACSAPLITADFINLWSHSLTGLRKRFKIKERRGL